MNCLFLELTIYIFGSWLNKGNKMKVKSEKESESADKDNYCIELLTKTLPYSHTCLTWILHYKI
jgi:hypothetical protein